MDLQIYEEYISKEIIYVYSKRDYEKLILILLETNRSQVSRETDINESWIKLADI